jgi:membrane protease YdiL (CAAX protease family)
MPVRDDGRRPAGSWPATIATVLLALLGPPLLAFASPRVLGPAPSLAAQVVSQLLLCSIAVIVLLVAIRVERQPLASVGLRRPSLATLGLAVLVTLAVMYLLPLLTQPLMRALGVGGFESGLDTIRRLPIWFRVFVASTSGFVEELLYRGYPVERLTELSGRTWVGGLLAVVAFGAAHVPFWGLGPSIAANLPFGAIMAAFYVWRRDLVANAGIHSALLLVSMLAVSAP